MLSPHDDDDDNHLCIKCNATIVGLENYIKHRKEQCGKDKTQIKPDLPPIDTLEPTYSLGADIFFQSLELQSSVKKSSLSRLTPPTTISKASIDTKNTMSSASTSRDIPRMSPLENNLRGEDWIGGHSLRIGINEDNQTKLINAVASISGNVKKDIPTSSYSIGPFADFKGDDDSDESVDSDEEDEEEAHGDKWKPPSNYTGGKWPPDSPEHEEWEEQEHMGGKWKPLAINDGNDRDEDYDAPPPGHTKGKWIPGANEKTQIMQTTIQSKGSVQYWCGPCNRRLGSRAIYDKHLMSNLHLRKVLPEQELEYSGHLEPARAMIDKRPSRPSLFVNESLYSGQKKRQKQVEPKITLKIEKKKRNRKPIFVQCSGCRSRVRIHLMGKHLISHYHFRKATNIKSEVYQKLILSNMDAIVHQSPFQCSPCKFYTNWLSNFMQHCYSEKHEQIVTSLEGRYWCSFCKYECDTSSDMLGHLTSSEHSEVVAAINRSMPIIIRKKSVLRCEVCDQEFRYNIEIKQHCQKTGHKLAYTASDSYQELHKCQHCGQKFKSSLTLAAHLKSRHKQQVFFCLVCSKTFKTSDQAKRHRESSEHRVRRKENLKDRGLSIKDLRKKCPYCAENVVLKNILELKDHIRRTHPNMKKKCSKCGECFIFSQEVTRHIRSNACQFDKQDHHKASILWNCSQCLYTTDSQAECFFHEVLHTEPITEHVKNPKYLCPFCSKPFKKASLREHIRQHTFERPYVCSICGANFTRQSSLANHCKNIHAENEIKLPKVLEKLEEFKCRKCKKKFIDRSMLDQHSLTCIVEERHCPHDQCSYIATSSAQLARHHRAHGERLLHKCTVCEFRTDQASHLKRHLICHEGTKPYACPHCHFTCGSLENLRKHVLRSNRHPGLHLYHCRSCTFKTNLATELRAHLSSDHADQFDEKTAIQEVKHFLMKSN